MIAAAIVALTLFMVACYGLVAYSMVRASKPRGDGLP